MSLTPDLSSLGYSLDETGIWCRTYTKHRTPPAAREKYAPRRKLTDVRIEEARLCMQAGLSISRVAQQFGVSPATMRGYLGVKSDRKKSSFWTNT